MTKDQEHLRLLTIFHYVAAAMTGLFALFPLIHLAVGLGIVTGTLPADNDAEARFVGWFFVIFAAFWILLGIGLAAAIAYAGRSLNRRTNYQYCFIVAVLSCLMVPYGTVLGVFTIIVLMRDSVKELFGRSVAAPAAPAAVQ